ncbi:MAG TPA: dTDP-4-dehydrorhamnose reductase [Methanomassiliicoccales archaeon]|nr:dTDP-4-dehydrorhamnose reductase [Methanomassiliicoccales archaeon]
MSRVAIVGGGGLLGQYLVRSAVRAGDDVLSTQFNEMRMRDKVEQAVMDLRDPDKVVKVLGGFRPDYVIVAAAMTNVDQCERSPTQSWEVNAEGSMNVAQACRGLRAKMLYVSTDYVFNGMKGTKYYEFDPPDPISIYGQTKLEGERLTMDADKRNLVCRVSVLYGHNHLSDKKNFVTWVMNELQGGREVRLFNDQFVSPTYAPHCADVLLDLVRTEAKGVVHTSGPDCVSRYSIGLAVADAFGLDRRLIKEVPTKDANLLARRPERACLSVDKVESLLDQRMMSLADGLARMKAGSD